MLDAAGFRIEHATHCMAPVFPAIGVRLHYPVFNSPALVILDQILSTATRWNYSYHRVKTLKKLAPRALFAVCRKP
ncbi:MAG: hypothetical protein ABSE35_02760 [Bryobacteraceae bacterium]